MTYEEFLKSMSGYCYGGKSIVKSSWDMGGTYGSCWSDELTPVSGSSEYTGYKLEDIIEDLPDMTIKQFAKLRGMIKITESESCDRDYYGGSTTTLHTSFDLWDVYDAMVKLEIIKEP